MDTKRFYKLYRIIAALAVFAVLVAAVPTAPVYADGISSFSIVSIKKDESVTIRTYNFPAYQLYTIRMDVVGKAAVDGIIVTYTNSGAGGSFEETYRIPAELRGKAQIAIRLESASGSYAYNWFNNVTSGTTSTGSTGSTSTGSTIPVTSSRGPNIKIVGVDANHSVTVDATLPTNTTFKVRIGPFYNFWRGSVIAGTINTEDTNTFRFTMNLPGEVRDVEWIAIRLDSDNGYYAYNAFKNLDASITTTDPGTNIPVTSSSCSITSYAPVSSIKVGSEFDAKWVVKNTSGKDWDKNAVDYAYRSGNEMQKREDRYDMPKTVKAGDSITIVVDMVAPDYTGWYSTTWALMKNNSVVCSLPLTIYVKE